MATPKTGRGLSRRALFKLGAATATVAAVANQGHAQQASGTRPNILFLMADQYRGDCLGAAGHPAVKTPNLDRIAKEGALFPAAYSSTPTCTPARAGLLTGRSPWNHGMLAYGKVAEHYPVELPQLLRDAGYYTLGIGKMHWHPQRSLHGFHRTILDESSREQSIDFRSDYRAWFNGEAPADQYDATGLDWNGYTAKPYVHPERLHPTHWTGETACRFIRGYEGDDPFFLKVSFARPHSPYDPPERFWKMYEKADIPKAVVAPWAKRYAKRGSDKVNTWCGDLGPEAVRKARQGYYGNITFIDEEVGRILASLEEQGVLDNTLIFFTADHGDMTGDHNLWRKSYPYEASARIPMLMRWPASLAKAKGGQTPGQPVELRDVLPTCLDAAGVPVPDGVDGQSMLNLVRGDTASWRPYLDLEHDTCYHTNNAWHALTDGRFKYIYFARTGEEQLFDLRTDPNELDDLALKAKRGKDLSIWRERLVEYLSERGERYVKDGKLVVRPKRILYSPNYPGTA